MIYLDNNATTRPADEVTAAVMRCLSEEWGNPSSVHRFGQRARKAIDDARAELALLLGCADSELTFTGGGTEASNYAIRGMLQTRAPRKRLVISTVEHSATRELSKVISRQGVEVVEIAVDLAGRIDLDALRSVIDDSVALVSMMWANNETGTLFPVSEIAAICKAARVPFHCDATQAIGKIPVDLHALGCDLATVAAHKFHGMKGSGALYIRRGVRCGQLIVGGPQERGRRGGTENVPGIVAMGVAAQLAKLHLPEMQRVASQRDRFEQTILETIEDCATNGDTEHRLPNTTNVGFSRLEAEAILLLLSEQSVCASAGAACSSGSLEPSHVLTAMKIDPLIAHGSIRFSLSRYTTDEELDRALEILPRVINRLRIVLPVKTH